MGLRLPHKGGVSPLRRLHVPGGLYLRPGGLDWLHRAAAWCGARGIALHVDPAAGETPDLAALRALHGIEAMPGVHLSVDPALRQALDGYGPGSLVLDLAGDLLARRLDAPAPVLDALAHGVPLLTNAGGDLAQRLVHAGAAVALTLDAAADGDTLDDALDGLAARPAAELGAMADAARDCAARWFDPADAASALPDALDRAVSARAGRRAAWGRAPAGTRHAAAGPGAVGAGRQHARRPRGHPAGQAARGGPGGRLCRLAQGQAGVQHPPGRG